MDRPAKTQIDLFEIGIVCARKMIDEATGSMFCIDKKACARLINAVVAVGMADTAPA